MIPDINCYKPIDIGSVLSLLEANENAKVIAGGTDIITGFHQGSSRFSSVGTLIDISAIPEMTIITENDDSIVIGGSAVLSLIEEHPGIKQHFPLLATAVSGIGSLQIRNRATMVGNFVNNAPCADSVPALLVYDAEITIQSKTGMRTMLLQDFLIKPYRTQLQKNELVTAVTLKKIYSKYRGNYEKLGRRRGVSISRITLAVLMNLDNNIISDIRFASGALTPIGSRFTDIENSLRGKIADDNLCRETAVEVGNFILNLTGIRWSTPYKLPVVQQMCYSQMSRIIRGEGL